jgi:hypothetical protein
MSIEDRHMKDWKKIASAYQFQIPESDFERISPALDSLEKAFRPLVESVPQDLGPAFVFRMPEEEME